jgi:hypothetical protein
MASIERTAYPRFKRTPTPHNLHALYTPTDAEIAFAHRAARSCVHQLSLLVLLKAFQRLGYFPKLIEVPTAIVSHIRSCLHLEQDVEPRCEGPHTLFGISSGTSLASKIRCAGYAASKLRLL